MVNINITRDSNDNEFIDGFPIKNNIVLNLPKSLIETEMAQYHFYIDHLRPKLFPEKYEEYNKKSLAHTQDTTEHNTKTPSDNLIITQKQENDTKNVKKVKTFFYKSFHDYLDDVFVKKFNKYKLLVEKPNIIELTEFILKSINVYVSQRPKNLQGTEKYNVYYIKYNENFGFRLLTDTDLSKIALIVQRKFFQLMAKDKFVSQLRSIMDDLNTDKLELNTIQFAEDHIHQLNNGIYDLHKDKFYINGSNEIKIFDNLVIKSKLNIDYISYENAKKKYPIQLEMLNRFFDKLSNYQPKTRKLFLQGLMASLDGNGRKTMIIIDGDAGLGKSLYGNMNKGFAGRSRWAVLDIDNADKDTYLAEINDDTILTIGDDLGQNVNISGKASKNLKTLITNGVLSVNQKYERNKTVQMKGIMYQFSNGLPKWLEDNNALNDRLIIVGVYGKSHRHATDSKIIEMSKFLDGLVDDYGNIKDSIGMGVLLSMVRHEISPDFTDFIRPESSDYKFNELSENSDYVMRFVEDLLVQGIISEDGSDGLQYIPHGELMSMLDYYIDMNAKGMKKPSSSKKLIERIGKAFAHYNICYELHEKATRMSSLYKPSSGIFKYDIDSLLPTYYYDKQSSNQKMRTYYWEFNKAEITLDDIQDFLNNMDDFDSYDDLSVKQMRIVNMLLYNQKTEDKLSYEKLDGFNKFKQLFPLE